MLYEDLSNQLVEASRLVELVLGSPFIQCDLRNHKYIIICYRRELNEGEKKAYQAGQCRVWCHQKDTQ